MLFLIYCTNTNIDKYLYDRITDRGGNEVELSIFKPEGYNDTWMYVEKGGKATNLTWTITIKEARQIYDATNCEHSQAAIKKYVVYH